MECKHCNLAAMQKDGFPAPRSGHTLNWGGASDPKGLWLFGGRSSGQRYVWGSFNFDYCSRTSSLLYTKVCVP